MFKDSPTHNLYVYEMRGSWNKENRTVLVGLYDGYQKAQAQKRNLSSEALKGFKVEEGAAANMVSFLVCKSTEYYLIHTMVYVLKFCAQKFLTKWHVQTVQTQIRLHLKEKSDQGVCHSTMYFEKQLHRKQNLGQKRME